MTRGRMSRDAKAAIAKAEAEGMTFRQPVNLATGKAPRTVTVTVPKAPRPALDLAVGQSYDPDRRRYERTQMFKGTDSAGKVWKVNAVQACKNCRYSLTGHECSNPTVLVGGGEWIEVTPV